MLKQLSLPLSIILVVLLYGACNEADASATLMPPPPRPIIIMDYDIQSISMKALPIFYSELPCPNDVILVFKRLPRYPPMMNMGIEGEVLVKLDINRKGMVEKATILKSSSSIFNEYALEAVNEWVFKAPSLLPEQDTCAKKVSVLFHFH